jgi:hypothetical protein
MGMRPPAGDDSEPESIEFGIAALDARVSEASLDFPATRSEVEAALGDIDVEYDASGNAVSLSRALEMAETEEFESERALLNALHPVFEELRQHSGPGFLGWVRSLFS